MKRVVKFYTEFQSDEHTHPPSYSLYKATKTVFEVVCKYPFVFFSHVNERYTSYSLYNILVQEGITPTWIAAHNGHLGALQLLKDSGANLETTRHVSMALSTASSFLHSRSSRFPTVCCVYHFSSYIYF